jgi:hypothetical protein
MKNKKKRLPKERNWAAVVAKFHPGAGRHKTDDEKRVQSKERKEIEEQQDG